MQWSFYSAGSELQTQALILPCFFHKTNVPDLPRGVREHRLITEHITLAWRRKEFQGKKGQLLLVPLLTGPVERLLLVGLGERKEWSPRHWMQTIGAALKALTVKPVDQCALVIPDLPKHAPSALAMNTGVAIVRALYQFKKYKSKEANKQESKEKNDEHSITAMILIGVESRVQRQWKKTFAEVETIVPFLNQQRDWGNMPSNDCTPVFLAGEAVALAKRISKLTASVMDKNAIRKSGMGALFGVARGAGEEPRFIILEYWGRGKGYKPFVLVGKGITFDTGGISIKPSEKMHEMKFDMLGAAAVINSVAAIASLKLPVNIVGLAPCTENVPGAEAYKPGDVLKAHNGSTIEVLNTDAEGRVILADALAWSHQYQPAAVVDLATLTGAAVVVLGNEGTPMISNDEATAKLVERAGIATNDRLWRLPLWNEFKEAIKSEVADVKNTTDGYGGSVITAAAFLEHFVKPLPWVHLDIAGTGWFSTAKSWTAAGATDMGVQLLVEVAKQWKAVKK